MPSLQPLKPSMGFTSCAAQEDGYSERRSAQDAGAEQKV